LPSAALNSFFWVFVLFIAQNFAVYLFPEKAPSLVLIGVLYYALFEGAVSGMVAGCFGGLLLDFFTQGRPGFFSAALAASGGLCGFLSSKIFEDSWLSEAVLPLVSLYFILFFQQVFMHARLEEPWFPAAFAHAFLPWPLVTTAASAPWVFGRMRLFSPRQRRRWQPRY
jgi:rod shape-determining protein MreD